MKNSSQAVYLVRHGQTSANKDLIIGTTDQPLSAEGKNQAQRLAVSFSQSIRPKIHSSSLSRAIHTARLLQAGSRHYVACSELINEMNFGDWENQSWNAVYKNDPEFFDYWARNWLDVAPPNGECFNDVLKRCRDWYNQSVRSEDLVIVAHGGSLRALLSIMLDIPADDLFSLELNHCHVTKIVINQCKAKALYLNNPNFI